MNTSEFVQLASAAVSPVLLGVVAFFLKSLYGRFDALEGDIRRMLIKGAATEERTKALERELWDLKKKIYDSIKN